MQMAGVEEVEDMTGIKGMTRIKGMANDVRKEKRVDVARRNGD
jgi:hypothetical protein